MWNRKRHSAVPLLSYICSVGAQAAVADLVTLALLPLPSSSANEETGTEQPLCFPPHTHTYFVIQSYCLSIEEKIK